VVKYGLELPLHIYIVVKYGLELALH